MLCIGCCSFGMVEILKKISFGNSIAFGKSTSQRIYPKQRTHKIGGTQNEWGLKHALHSLDGHFK